MDKKSKVISGLNSGTVIRKPSKYFNDTEKHLIIKEMHEVGCTKRDIWEKYTGQVEEHGQLLRWMRKLGYTGDLPNRRPNFASTSIQMKKKNTKGEASESFENLLSFFKRW